MTQNTQLQPTHNLSITRFSLKIALFVAFLLGVTTSVFGQTVTVDNYVASSTSTYTFEYTLSAATDGANVFIGYKPSTYVNYIDPGTLTDDKPYIDLYINGTLVNPSTWNNLGGIWSGGVQISVPVIYPIGTQVKVVVHDGIITNPATGSYTFSWKTAAGSGAALENFSKTITLPQCTSPSLTVSSTHSVSYGASNFTITPSSSSTGTITYSSTNTAVASVNSSTGEVSVVGAGTVTITASQASEGSYCSDSDSMVLTVSKKTLTVSGITATDKVYNGTTSATLDGSAISVTGIINSDDVTVTYTGLFADKAVATNKTVTITTVLSGTNSPNYTLSAQSTTTASITQKSMTINGITASDKAYDGTTSATIDYSSIAYNGKVGSDSVSATFTGVFSDANTAVGKTVTLTGTATGTDVGNYDITFQASTTATITARGGVSTSYYFTNAGATGRTGPTQTQVNSAYSGGALAGLVTINTQGIQEWTVPETGDYQIKVAGGQGGSVTYPSSSPGGRGVIVQGSYSLVKGNVLKIAVGHQGVSASGSTYNGAGGGGGSFVVLSDGNVPLFIAGGGGGDAA